MGKDQAQQKLIAATNLARRTYLSACRQNASPELEEDEFDDVLSISSAWRYIATYELLRPLVPLRRRICGRRSVRANLVSGRPKSAISAQSS